MEFYCYILLGALDPRCLNKTTTTKRIIAFVNPGQELNEIPISTTIKPSISSVSPQCYPKSLDPRCGQLSTTTTQRTPKIPVSQRLEIDKIPTSSTLKPVPSISSVPSLCYLGSRDPKCRQLSTTTQRTSSPNLISKVATAPSKPKSIPSCYPG